MAGLGTGATRLGCRGMAVGLILALGLAACDEPAPAQRAAGPAPAVVVMQVERRPITQTTEFIGRAEAIDKLDVRARVTGFLQARHFTEGQDVKAGDPLFTIEQGPFTAEVALRQAQVERAQAELTNATTQVARGRELLRTNDLSQARFDERVTEENRNKANLAAAEAELQQAQIQLGYTEIRAVFDGRAGRSPLSPGNVVGPDSGILVTVVRDDPMRVSFPVTQRELLAFRRAGGPDSADRLKVRIRLPDGSMLDTTGRIDFIDNASNRSTDSVLVQASVPNPRRLLSDGQAVTVVIEAAEPEQAIMIPQSAIQIDQQGTFVLVVGAENKVEVKRIRTTPGPAGQTRVTEGLEPGAMIITEGSQRARPGQAVTPRPADPPPAGTVPANAARAG